jgi:hypothetical protein
MNSVIVSLLKNLILVALLILSLVNYFTHTFNWHDLVMIQLIVGVIYVFLAYYEVSNTWYKAQLPKERFAYYPGSFFARMAIGTGAYLMMAVVLALSGSTAKFLYPICLIIALTKIVVSVLVVVKKLSFVSIYANYIMVAKDKVVKVFSNELESVEYRHDIIYLVKKDKETLTIKVFSIKEPKIFVKQMHDWVINNNLSISVESLTRWNHDIALSN